MFIRKNASLEIESSMQKSLISNAVDKNNERMNKFASAVEHLNVVAEIFDDLGLYNEAEATTRLMEVIAAKKSKKSKKPAKTKKKIDPAMKGLTSEKMVENLKHKGWVFNADDHDYDCECSGCTKKAKNHGQDCACSYCMDDLNNVELDVNNHFDTESDFSHHIENEDEQYLAKQFNDLLMEEERNR